MKSYPSLVFVLISLIMLGGCKKNPEVKIVLKDNVYAEIPEAPEGEIKELRHIVFQYAEGYPELPAYTEQIVTKKSVNAVIMQVMSASLRGGVDSKAEQTCREVVRIRVEVPTISTDNFEIQRLSWVCNKYWNKEDH